MIRAFITLQKVDGTKHTSSFALNACSLATHHQKETLPKHQKVMEERS